MTYKIFDMQDSMPLLMKLLLIITVIILYGILSRIEQALKAGFRHLVFEDNYDTGTGDHYSLRQICDQSYIRGM